MQTSIFTQQERGLFRNLGVLVTTFDTCRQQTAYLQRELADAATASAKTRLLADVAAAEEAEVKSAIALRDLAAFVARHADCTAPRRAPSEGNVHAN